MIVFDNDSSGDDSINITSHQSKNVKTNKCRQCSEQYSFYFIYNITFAICDIIHQDEIQYTKSRVHGETKPRRIELSIGQDIQYTL
jgi:hypothetical protein